MLTNAATPQDYWIVINECLSSPTNLRKAVTAKTLSHFIHYVTEHMPQFWSLAVDQTDVRPPQQSWLK